MDILLRFTFFSNLSELPTSWLFFPLPRFANVFYMLCRIRLLLRLLRRAGQNRAKVISPKESISLKSHARARSFRMRVITS